MRHVKTEDKAWAASQIRKISQRNRPRWIVLGLLFAGGAIYIDFFLEAGKRAAGQEILWSICTLGSLLIAIRKFLNYPRLLLPIVLTLIAHGLIIVLAGRLLPLDNSLTLLFFWLPELLLLFLVLAVFARLLDPNGARPDPEEL
ncbi:hypothetical protein RBB79_07335 [Tunturiibacter empetritectus]|uniref:Uncharacterized protein n=2 Tax=Tunturiibacter TaxID=3154218 RepID=A0A852VEJ3_9BACT|nr:hypothetical protein [Edaphobacter lichenicola]NYF89349.1 hypothetical protein [Edaphobacter lichenicola]